MNLLKKILNPKKPAAPATDPVGKSEIEFVKKGKTLFINSENPVNGIFSKLVL
jgi:hypothetical protein